MGFGFAYMNVRFCVRVFRAQSLNLAHVLETAVPREPSDKHTHAHNEERTRFGTLDQFTQRQMQTQIDL